MSTSQSSTSRHVRRNAAYDQYCQLMNENKVPPRWTQFRAVSTNQYVLADALNRAAADVLNLALRKFGMGSQFATFWMHLEMSEEHLVKLQAFWLCQLLAHASEQAIAMKTDEVSRLSASSNALEYCIQKFMNEISSGSKPFEMSILWTDCAVLSGTYAIARTPVESHVEEQALTSLTRSLQAVTKWFGVSALSPQCNDPQSLDKLQNMWHNMHLKWTSLGPESSDPEWNSRMYCILIESACQDLDNVVETYDISYLVWHQWLGKHFSYMWQPPESAQRAPLIARNSSTPSPSRPTRVRPQRYQSMSESGQASPRRYRPGRRATLSSLSAAAEYTQGRIETSPAQLTERDRALAPTPSEVQMRTPQAPEGFTGRSFRLTEHEMRELRFLGSQESLMEVSVPPPLARQQEIRSPHIANQFRAHGTGSSGTRPTRFIATSPVVPYGERTNQHRIELQDVHASLHSVRPVVANEQQAGTATSPVSRVIASEQPSLGRRASATKQLRRLSRWASLKNK